MHRTLWQKPRNRNFSTKNGVFNTRTLAAHGVYLTNRDMSILARRGVSVAHNPVSNLKLASGIANVTAMLKSGVNVSSARTAAPQTIRTICSKN